MPGYTRAWNAINWLLGSRDADEIDNGVREAGLDLDERLRDILEDVEADPWRLKTTGAITVLPWQVAQIHTFTAGTVDYNIARLTLSAAASALTAYFPVIAPKGSTLTNVIVRALRTHAGASVLVSLIRINNDNTTTNIVNGFAVSVDPNPQDIDLGALTELFDEGVKFIVAVTITSEAVVAASAAVYHVQVTTDTIWGGA